MQIEGITWHGVMLEPDQFSAMKRLLPRRARSHARIERDGWTLFPMQNGTVLDLFESGSELIPAYGYNEAIVFGFRVDDIEAAVVELEAAGCELLCEARRVPEMHFAFCHFRGPDGRVYGINQQM